MLINLVLYKRIFIYLFKTASITFLSYTLFELLDVEHGSPISHKNVKCNSLELALAIDAPPPKGESCTLEFTDTTLYKPQNEICKPSESGSVSV